VRWAVTALLVLAAAAGSAAAVYLVMRDEGGSTAATTPPTTVASNPKRLTLAALVPGPLWRDCKVQSVPDPGATETAVCLPPRDAAVFAPDRWQVSIFPSAAALRRAYDPERARHDVARDTGTCTGSSWGGEGGWVHGPGQPGGRRLCYFEGNEAVIVWSHDRLGQPNHRDILALAREGGGDHARLFNWWRFWHHRIGKAA
jgi:hypothetical protein